MRASARLPGTYAASFDTEKSWVRGLGILWTLCVLTILLEALNAACYLLAVKIIWPPDSQIHLGDTSVVLPLDAGRLALMCTFFAALWVGWGWLRYLLATVDFLSGLWLVVGMIASAQASPRFKAFQIADAPIYSRVESLPKMALGIIYLATAAYVVFSVDVQEFLAHRRIRGRVGSALLVILGVYGCMVLVLGAQPLYNLWLHTQRPGAIAFGEDTLRTMADGWSPDCIDDRLDPEFAKSFTPDNRKATFAGLRSLGQLRRPHSALLAVITTTESHPLQNIVPAPSDLRTTIAGDGTGFRLWARYSTTGAEYEHGKVHFGIDLARDLFGPWRIVGLDAVTDRLDPPLPAASAAPATSPANPAATPVPPTGG